MEKINFEPCGSLLLIKRNKIEEKSKGGIILVAKAQSKPNEGVICGIGPMCKQSWEANQRVIFGDIGSFETGDFVLVQEDQVYLRYK